MVNEVELDRSEVEKAMEWIWKGGIFAHFNIPKNEAEEK